MDFFKKAKYKKIIKEAEEYRNNLELEKALEKYYEAFEIIINVHDYFIAGFIELELNHYDKAITILSNIEKEYLQNRIDGDMADVYFGLGVAYDSLKQRTKAIDYYELAIKENTHHPECYYFAGLIYDDLDLDEDDPRTQKAIQYYKKAIELEPKYIYAYVNLGNILSKFEHNEECLQYFLKAKELDVNYDTNCDYNLGVAYQALSDYDKAEKYYLDELKQKNPYPSTYYNLGILYKDMLKKDKNNYQKSRMYYLKAIEINKDDFNAWYNLGCLYALGNDYDNAFECFTYLKYNKRSYLKTMETDNELIELRKDARYNKLINER